MISLLQRVTEARALVAGATVGEISAGILALVCAEPGDSTATADRLLERILGYRIFPDDAGKMNRSLRQAGGGLLLVPQFTLGADTTTGTRPSFSTAAAPDLARQLFEHLVARAREAHFPVAAGQFGEHMSVGLVNDGPVTFWLRAPPARDEPGTR
jgi:D-tyrosyl-tRNA(Tyr) deacylase